MLTTFFAQIPNEADTTPAVFFVFVPFFCD